MRIKLQQNYCLVQLASPQPKIGVHAVSLKQIFNTKGQHSSKILEPVRKEASHKNLGTVLLCSLCNLLQQNSFLHGGGTRVNAKYLTVTKGFCRLKRVKSWALVESLPVFWEQAVDRKGSTQDRCLSLAVNLESPTIFYDKKLKLSICRHESLTRAESKET